ncbi:MAG: hypothetical protein K2P59_08830 [Acetatifactor sp.]|nr:hypothetical protein [Acetatifactor sp.]
MVYSFEEGIPEGITAVNSTVRTDREHYRDGEQSLCWETEGGAELILKGPVEYRHFRAGGPNQDRCCFVIWLYREEAGAEAVRFSFYKKGRKCCHFDFGQDFRGWRTCWVPFRDMEGEPEEGMDEIRLSRTGDGREHIWLDQMITSVPIDPRHPVPDLQVPFVNPSVDKAVNAHWTSLLRFLRLERQQRERLCAAESGKSQTGREDEEKLRKEINFIEERMERYFLGIFRLDPGETAQEPASSPGEISGTVEAAASLWEQYAGLNLKKGRNGLYGGVNVDAVHHWAAYPGEEAERLKTLTGAVGIRKCGGLLLRAACLWHEGDNLLKEEAAGHFAELLQHLWEQGWAAGSSLGTTHHMGYLMRELYVSVFLMRKPLKEKGLLADTAEMTGWFSGRGRIFREPEELQGESTDTLNTLLWGILCSILMTEDECFQIHCLHAFRDWLNAVLKPAPGLEGPYKADGSTFHHAAHYPAYAVGGFQGAAPVVYALSGTRFALGREAHQTMRNALLCMRLYCNRYNWPVSMSARHPRGVGEMSGITDLRPFYCMAMAGLPGAEAGEDGAVPVDAEMAGALLRLAEYKPFPPGEELRTRGYRAERAPEGHFVMNYACAGIHRREEWMACVRGHSRYLWGNETYEKNNLYGRYITYGSLQILGSGTPVNNGDSGFRQEGWDWNHFPGTTSVVLPWEELRQRVCVVDEFAGFEEMLLSDEAFAGGVSFEGRQGCFGMKLHGHAKYDGSLRARKSWFFFEDRIICLGSDVEDGREKYETVTTLYQHWLGKESSGKCPTENAAGGTESGGDQKENDRELTKYPGDTVLKLRDPSGNEYIVPAGQQVVVTRGIQESRTQDTGEPAFARYEKAWISHGNAPRREDYEYMIRIRSESALAETEISGVTGPEDGEKSIYRILRKNEALHAVYDEETGIYAYVFFEACSVTERDGGTVLRAETPCLIMERLQGEELHISFCDPDLRLYEGQEPDQLDENGNQKEVSLYSRTWLKNESIGKWCTVILKGHWSLSEETAEVQAQIRDGETELRFWGKDGAGREVTLRRT